MGTLLFQAILKSKKWKSDATIDGFKLVLLCTYLIFLPSASSAFSTLGSEHAQLKNTVIVDIGEAKEVSAPTGATWKNQVYSLNSSCFTMFGYYDYWGFGGKSAMIVVGQDEVVRLAVLENSIGNISVKLNPIQMIQCPSHTNLMPSCDGLSHDACLELMNAYEAKLDRQLKALGK